MVRYGCDCTVFAKGLVGSNTEVTGKIPVSSQKYEAEKLYRLGKKRLNCIGDYKDQNLLLIGEN